MALAAATALLLALAATARNETGVLAPAPAPAPGPQPPPPWERPQIWAASNRGLAPQRLVAYNKTHYYQLLPAGESRGLVVMFHPPLMERHGAQTRCWPCRWSLPSLRPQCPLPS